MNKPRIKPIAVYLAVIWALFLSGSILTFTPWIISWAKTFRDISYNNSIEVKKIHGTLNQDTIWDVNVEIDGDVFVPANIALTIQPNVTVTFYDSTSLLITGTLQVNGTATQPVLFTSNQATPAPGDWARIDFYPGSAGTINYATIEYGGHSSLASLQIDGGDISIQNSIIRYSNNQGIRSRVWLNILNNQFNDNLLEAVRINLPVLGPSAIRIGGNTGSGNGRDIIFIEGDIPETTSLDENPGLPYIVESTLEIPSGRTLTVGEGSRFEMGLSSQPGGAIDILGVLNVNGTAGNPVVFTSYNEASGLAKPGDWLRIYLQPGSAATLDYATIQYSGYASAAIYAEDAYVTINNCDIGSNAYYGIYSDNSNINVSFSTIHDNSSNGLRILAETTLSYPPNISNNTFNNNQDAAIVVRIPTMPVSGMVFNNNTGADNTINGIMFEAILGDTTLYANPGLPYVVESLTVAENATVQVTAGTVFKLSRLLSPEGTLIKVFGTLYTQGGADSPVVFTSIADDSWGGKTVIHYENFLPIIARDYQPSIVSQTVQQSGISSPPVILRTQYTPIPGDWRGIVVYSNAQLIMDYTIVQYAGFPDIAQVQVLGGYLKIDHGSILYGLRHGVYAEDTSPDIRNSDLSYNQEAGLRIYGNTQYLQPVILSNTFYNNGTYGVYLILNGGGMGTGIITGNSGSGNRLVNGIFVEGLITDDTSYWGVNTDFPYVIWTITINAQAKLTLAPGAVVKFIAPPDDPSFQRGTGTLIVEGSLRAVGDVNNLIYFTSYWDDGIGGDTNGIIGGSYPLPGDWIGLIVRDGGYANLQYAEFRYGGSGGWNVWSDGGAIDMSYSGVYYSSTNGIGGRGTVWVTYSKIANNLGNGIQLTGDGGAHWNVILSNGNYGMVDYSGGILPGENNYWGEENGPSYDGLPCSYQTPTGSGSMINCLVSWDPYLSSPP